MSKEYLPHDPDYRPAVVGQVEPTVMQRAEALETALRDSLEQLEGWVSWKCPKKYRQEHEAFLARQRAVLEGKA